MKSVFLAREKQTLSEHLSHVAKYSEQFAQKIKCPNVGYALGILHDIGKYSSEFQEYLERSIKKNAHRGEVIHSLQGVRYCVQHFPKRCSRQIIGCSMGNILASHHGELSDMLDDGKDVIETKSEKNAIDKSYEEICREPEALSLLKQIRWDAIKTEYQELIWQRNSKFISHLYVRMLYSCLVDADRCDAAGIIPSEKIPNWDYALEKLHKRLSEFSQITELDQIKTKISDQCATNAHRPKGIYTFSAPTGSGKTFASFRYALVHAKVHKMHRIVYVIPYLSILEQTADVLRHDVFKEEYDNFVLEHHSNIEITGDNQNGSEELKQRDLLTSRWDSPIILTTMVRFLETIYSNKASELRKFHNFANTVFVFDEIQSLPVNCIYLFNEAVNFLKQNAGSSFLLCTATQPILGETKEHNLSISNPPSIVTISDDEIKLFKRVNIIDKTEKGMSSQEIANFAEEQFLLGKSVLVIMNTKKTAEKVFDSLSEICPHRFYLSTNLCPAHRADILHEITEKLNRCESDIICVTTQLIEAGVDVSFGCVIRAQAGLDSIVQAAGRCNRNRESSEPMDVFVVDAYEEKLGFLDSIKQGKKQTQRVFDEKKDEDFLHSDIIELYYKYYYGEQKEKMWYPTGKQEDDISIYEMLDTNLFEYAKYWSCHSQQQQYSGIPAAYRRAAEKFSVIQGNHIGIVVPYMRKNENEVYTLVEQFKNTSDNKKRSLILKKLQKYTITVYAGKEHDIANICESVCDTFYLLSSQFYDKQKGLVADPIDFCI